ncbi:MULTISPECIES: hypothetical protein [Methylobacterium]|uniref:Uncharacterized protein n=1 Tax=Methylobacterium ajmalii TaxID=2738439 RepID=A0ABV0A8G5_9HYPH|nr:hypothetical protein [Methylobacterium aquaticum]
MTDLLRRAAAALERLPPDRQDVIARGELVTNEEVKTKFRSFVR